jgi:hypothetical protein
LDDREKDLQVSEFETAADTILRSDSRHRLFLLQVEAYRQFRLYRDGTNFAFTCVRMALKTSAPILTAEPRPGAAGRKRCSYGKIGERGRPA